ncbi:hypothetical protein, conserved [Eimeria maxima]|uniref:Uncharacterized protein n=1 Tax=Eimeria maxima TaxID=5804 RepID=U6MAX8_EIMMA|nr:hypothetical protein, conserved [Eimeria maxima]CDJ59619.1 hypothetical protein, conserved [Eimeria maxima]
MLFRSGFRHGSAVQAAGLLLVLLVLLPLLPVAVLLLTREQRQLNEQQQQQQQRELDLAAAGVRPLGAPLSIHPVKRQQQHPGSSEPEALPIFLMGQQMQEEHRELHQPEKQMQQHYGHPLWHLLKGETASETENPQQKHQHQQQRQQRDEKPNGWIPQGLLAEMPEDPVSHGVSVSVAMPSAAPPPPSGAARLPVSALTSMLPAEYHTGVMPLHLAPSSPPAAVVGSEVANDNIGDASRHAEGAAITTAPPTFMHQQLQQQLLRQQQQQLLHRQQHWTGSTRAPLHPGTPPARPLPSAQQVYLHRTAAAPLVLSPFGGSATSPTRQQQQLYSQHQQPLSYLLLPSRRATVASAAPASSSLVELESEHQGSSGLPHLGAQQQVVQHQKGQQVQKLHREQRHLGNDDEADTETATLQESDSPAIALSTASAGAQPAIAAGNEPSLLPGFVNGDNKQTSEEKADTSAADAGALPHDCETANGRSAASSAWEPRTSADTVADGAAELAPEKTATTASLKKDIRWNTSPIGKPVDLPEAELEQTAVPGDPTEIGSGAGGSSTHRRGTEGDDESTPGKDRNPEEAGEPEESESLEAKTGNLHLAASFGEEAEEKQAGTVDKMPHNAEGGMKVGLQARATFGGKREQDSEDGVDNDDSGDEDEVDGLIQLLPSSSGSSSSTSSSSTSSSSGNTRHGKSHQVHWLDGDLSSLSPDLQREGAAGDKMPLHDDQWEPDQQHQQWQEFNPATAKSGDSLRVAVSHEAMIVPGAASALATAGSDAEPSVSVSPIAAALPGSSLSKRPVVGATKSLTGHDLGARVRLHPGGDPTMLLLQQPLQQHLQQPTQQQVIQPVHQQVKPPLQEPLHALPQPLQQPLPPPLQQQLGDASSLLTPQELIKQQQLQLQQQQAMMQQLQQQVAMQQDLLLRAQEQQLQQTQHQRMQQQQQQLLHMQLAHVSEKQQVQGALLQHHLHQLQQQQLQHQKLQQLQQQPLQSQTQVL